MSGFCAMDLFEDFTFDNIRTAKPPAEKGVYAIRIKSRGTDPEAILAALPAHIERLNREVAGDYRADRIGRIWKIDARCPIIYIGSAGTGKTSRHTLAGRYKALTCRHTAQYPVRALLNFGWELEFGWKVSDTLKELEAACKISLAFSRDLSVATAT
jgi:hypothetical protein